MRGIQCVRGKIEEGLRWRERGGQKAEGRAGEERGEVRRRR